MCTKPSNMSCYSITDNNILRSLSSCSNVVFICEKCIAKSKSKNIRLSSDNRLSSDSRLSPDVIRRSSAPSLDITTQLPEARDSIVSSQNSSSQIDKLFEIIANKLNGIENKINNIEKVSNEIMSDESKKTKTNTTATYTTISEENQTLDNIYKLLLKTADNINKLHTSDNERESLQKITSLLDKNRINSAAKKQTNLLDWSLQDSYLNTASDDSAGRQSLMVKQSVDDDVLQILKSSDETTWYTLDIIIKHLKEHGVKLDSLLSSGKSERESVGCDDNFSLKSPLIDAIRESSNDSISFIPIDTQTENSALNALHTLDSLVNSHDSDIDNAQSSSPDTGNPSTMNKRSKEAMSHLNTTKNVPETLKSHAQKRLSPNSSGGWSKNTNRESTSQNATDSHNAELFDAELFDNVPRSEVINLFLNDAGQSELNSFVIGSSNVPDSASSLIEESSKTSNSSRKEEK